MSYDVVIVGGGMAGLTAAAYLCKAGRSVVIAEKEEQVGGLVNSFRYNDFVFDGGIRAIENSGIIMPMLRQLGISMEFVNSPVTIGIGDDFVRIETAESLDDYRDMLIRQFPENRGDIEAITADIRRIMEYLGILYGIDNPLFLDMAKDREYLIKTIVPWMFKYLFTIRKIERLDEPVVPYLRRFTKNHSLIDMIAQHFFQGTPVFFALSYFSLYLDYQYPLGGTGTLVDKMTEFILSHGGKIATGTDIFTIHPLSRTAVDRSGRTFQYRQLVWAADMKKLYRSLDMAELTQHPALAKIKGKKAEVADKRGGDSVLTLYLAVDLDPEFFGSVCSAHCFYTPDKTGLSTLDTRSIQNDSTDPDLFIKDQDAITAWVQRYLQLTTYEISVPVLRDSSLAPPGKTGLIISTLFNHALVQHIADMGWYDAFKTIAAQEITEALNNSLFPGLAENITDRFTATPLTIEQRTGNTDGAITGWAFTNSTIPAVHRLTQIARSVVTPVPDIVQAGQWTYSPSGLPISVLTGKLAADKVLKELKRQG
jgi:phytoene dehydrogenase-like protein